VKARELGAARAIVASRIRGTRVPVFVGAAVTSRCDGVCVFCRRAGGNGDDLDTRTWMELLEGMARAGTCRVSFTGGEPLLRDDVGRLVHEARRLGLGVNISTNGQLLDSRLEEIARADGVTVSFEGPEPVMDRLRGRDAHAKAVRGIEAALGAGLPLVLRSTLSSLNVDRVDEILAEARTLGARVSFAPLRSVPLGGGDPALLPEESLFRVAVERLIQQKRRGDRTVLNSMACLEHYRRWPEPAVLRCSAGRIYARVEPDGWMYACGDEVTSARRESALDLGFEEAFRRIEPSGCDACWCDSRVEMNLLHDLNVHAIREALHR